MTDSDRPRDPAGRAARQLQHIAEALGIPVEALFARDGAGPAVDRLSELLRLWQAIRDAAGHEAVLARAREVVAAQSEAGPG